MTRSSRESDALPQVGPETMGERVRSRFELATLILWPAAFLVNMLLNLGAYLGLAIAPWDEARYLSEAHEIANGRWPALADNPGFGLLNWPLYHFYHLDPLWAFRLDAFDRLLCIGGFWLTAYLVSGELGLLARLRYLQAAVSPLGSC